MSESKAPAASASSQAEYDNKIGNLNAIFQCSMQAKQMDDGTKPTSAEAMDPERRAFLRKVMDERTVDPTEEIKKVKAILEKPDAEEGALAEKLNALQQL